ncbi:MAG: hypothetical protein MRECE_34c014 [Mycoplasmataceae bacterium CE_OT135]|nr:MAG: hypothetical protein MRECE_34c014 [Mycoplasmataceae bacterium CE_OT135]
MTKTNELLPNNPEPQENFAALGNNFASHSPKTKSKRHWKHTKPDIQKQCFICDLKFPVKYNLPRQRYSQKNLWGYWTEKPTDQKKYICNSCLKKNLLGRFEEWGVRGEKSRIFHVYLSRNKFETTT